MTRDEVLKHIQDFLWKPTLDLEGSIAVDKAAKIVEDPDYTFQDFLDEVYEDSLHVVCDIEQHVLKEIHREFEDEITEYALTDEDLLSTVLVVTDHSKLDTRVPVRVELLSNYESMEPHVIAEYANDGYFRDILTVLKINKQTMKRFLLEQGYTNLDGNWENRPTDTQALVSLKSLWGELINNTTNSRLCFLGMVDVSQITKPGEIYKVAIPKGNSVGLFSSLEGGGSAFEMKLLRDATIFMNRKNKTEYDRFVVKVDAHHSYSVKDVYGCGDAMFGGEITVYTRSKKGEQS